MTEKNSHYLRREIKEFIHTMHEMLEKSNAGQDPVDEDLLQSFADKIWKLNHFSTQLLNSKNLDESTTYNARIIKELTESPLSIDAKSKQTCSLVKAADHLKRDREFYRIKIITTNLVKDELASEVLIDDLMLIYKELAA